MSRSHDDAPLPPPTLVEDAGAFRELLARLADAEEIAIDTEADSFYSYQERVCLVQVSVGAEDWVVDPLAGFDLGGLGEVLADPRRTKVFHDGEYDVLILKRDYGFRFAGLFDTRVAAAALGLEAPGLASVVQERFGVELDKSQQRSDWSRRPLTPSQVEYARQDTRYLVPLMHALSRELEEHGRMPIVAGECRRLEALEPPERGFDPEGWARLKGARRLDPRGMRRLRELYAWRDAEARERDVPPFKVLGNGPLLELARARLKPSAGPRALERVPGLSPRVVKRIGRDLARVLEEAERLGPLERFPSLPARDGSSSLDEAGVELHERLKAWRKERASAMGIDSSLVLNRHALLRLAEERPTDAGALARIDGLVPWQLDLFGDELLRVVRGFEADLAAGRVELGRRRRRQRDRR